MNKDKDHASTYQGARQAHWDEVARKKDNWTSSGAYYHQRLAHIYQFLVPPGQRVLEIGCGMGDLLAALNPRLGVGIDFSSEMLKRGAQKHPHIHFIQNDGHHLSLKQKFDVIILSDLVNDLWDVQAVFKEIAQLSAPGTRIIINTYSRLWELPLALAQRRNLATPVLNQNWLTVEDITSLLNLADFEVIRHWEEFLWPLGTPLLAGLCNRFLVKLWPFRYLALTNLIIARPLPSNQPREEKPLVSVIVPARNEAGNIPIYLPEHQKWAREPNWCLLKAIPKTTPSLPLKRQWQRILSASASCFNKPASAKAMQCGWALTTPAVIY
jgi:ubiquinone/menaquinone biosynthesis C-methylase UbiE